MKNLFIAFSLILPLISSAQHNQAKTDCFSGCDIYAVKVPIANIDIRRRCPDTCTALIQYGGSQNLRFHIPPVPEGAQISSATLYLTAARNSQTRGEEKLIDYCFNLDLNDSRVYSNSSHTLPAHGTYTTQPTDFGVIKFNLDADVMKFTPTTNIFVTIRCDEIPKLKGYVIIKDAYLHLVYQK